MADSGGARGRGGDRVRRRPRTSAPHPGLRGGRRAERGALLVSGGDHGGGFVPNLEVDAVRWLTPPRRERRSAMPMMRRCSPPSRTSPPPSTGPRRHPGRPEARARHEAGCVGRTRPRPPARRPRARRTPTALIPVLAAYGVDRGALVRHDALPRHGRALRDCHVPGRRRRAARCRSTGTAPSPRGRAVGSASSLEPGAGRRAVLPPAGAPCFAQGRDRVPEAKSVIGEGLPPGAMVVIHHVHGEVLAVERHDP